HTVGRAGRHHPRGRNRLPGCHGRRGAGMRFPGFNDSDFELFALPEFGARMGAIRSELRPKLVALGEDLAPPLAEILGAPLFPHAAVHMRRRVNPPNETWAAF